MSTLSLTSMQTQRSDAPDARSDLSKLLGKFLLIKVTEMLFILKNIQCLYIHYIFTNFDYLI